MKALLVVALLCSACSTQTEPNLKPSLDGQHTLPHNGPCHAGETESQGQGGFVTCTAA